MLIRVVEVRSERGNTPVLCADADGVSADLIGREAQVLRDGVRPLQETVILDLVTDKERMTELFPETGRLSRRSAVLILRGAGEDLISEHDWLTTDPVSEKGCDRLRPVWHSGDTPGCAGPRGHGLAWDPSGQRLATVAGDKSVIRVWAVPGGEELLCLEGHRDMVQAIAWSPDGARIASVDKDWLRVWDAATGGEQWRQRVSELAPFALAWSPDGENIVVGGGLTTEGTVVVLTREGTVTVLKATSGQRSRRSRPGVVAVTSVGWSPDGARIAAGSRSGMVHLWEVATGKETGSWRGSRDDVLAIAWSPDGRRLAAGGADEIRVRELATETTREHQTNGTASITWRPDGTEYASAQFDGSIRIWDAETSTELRRFGSHRNGLAVVAWDPRGKWLAADGWESGVRVRDAATGEDPWQDAGHHAPVGGIAWSPDGRRLITGSADGEIRCWSPGVSRAAFWRAKTQPNRQLGDEIQTALDGTRGLLAMSPDGAQFAVAGERTLRLCSTVDGTVTRQLPECRNTLETVAWSADGRWLAVGGYEQLLVWNLSADGPAWQPAPRPGIISAVAWSPAGNRLAAADNRKLKIWGLPGGETILDSIGVSPFDTLLALAWRPDGNRIALASKDGGIFIRDAATGAELRSWRGHAGQIETIAWSADGRWLATGGADQALRVWDPATGRCLAAVRVRPGVGIAALAIHGQRIALGGSDGLVRVYEYSGDGGTCPATGGLTLDSS